MLLYSKTLYAIYLNSGNFGTAFLVLLAFFSILNFKHFRDTYFFLFLTFVLYAIIEVISTYLIKTSQNIQWINYFYAILAATLPSVFYLKSIKNNLLNKITIPFILVFVLFSIIQFGQEVFYKKPFEQVFLFPLKNVIAIFLALVFHTKLSQSTKIKSLKNEPSFWFNIGFFIINVSNLIILPIFKAVTPFSDNLGFIFGTVYQVADPITYTLWAIGVYKLKTQPFRPIASLWP